MFYARVEQHQLIANGLEGEIFKFAAAAVETHQALFFAKHAGKLVHDATIYATVVMLGSLSGQRHIPLAHLVIAKQIVQSKGEATF